jgi:hypothetical protein
MLSAVRQGLSHIQGRLERAEKGGNLTVSAKHLVIGKWKVAVIQGYRYLPGDGIPGFLAPAGRHGR